MAVNMDHLNEMVAQQRRAMRRSYFIGAFFGLVLGIVGTLIVVWS